MREGRENTVREGHTVLKRWLWDREGVDGLLHLCFGLTEIFYEYSFCQVLLFAEVGLPTRYRC
jgi:hypothetical protein